MRDFLPFTLTTRRKLASVLLTIGVFAILGVLTTRAVGRPVEIGTTTAILIGTGIGLFEEFYVQSLRGNWLRRMHPLRSIPIYIGVVIILYLISLHVGHLLLGRLDDLPAVYARLPYGVSIFTAFSIVAILLIRVAHFVGLGTMLHLLLGTYHRPVVETKVLLFLDINGSTALTETLGPFRTQLLVGKFLFDVSTAITNYGGDVYLYKGDGLIAVWSWNEAVTKDAILRAVDAMTSAVSREHRIYERQFGIVPAFRVGIHGGEVVVSEQGDSKRSIGIYGDTINIAARMEETAKAHNIFCVVSGPVADALTDQAHLHPLGAESIRGISVPLRICEYQPVH